MTTAQLARTLFALHDRVVVSRLTAATCRHGELHPLLEGVVNGAPMLFRQELLGHSLEGRTITRISFGSGPLSVLLWSQMHGDEPTATLALVDVFNFLLGEGRECVWVSEMLRAATVHCILMLNPDGAERCQRYTAAHIDINRDAVALASPEARVLKRAHEACGPAFALNLHDQDVSSAGNLPAVSALALLAPALDNENSVPAHRLRAMQLGALLVSALSPFVEGHIATYDDAFEPRAFGDRMQSWGTSTLLIESGHWPGDPGKGFIRKLNFVALLCAIKGIADRSYESAELLRYAELKPNGKKVFDLIIRDVTLRHASGWSHRVDLGLSVAPGQPDRFDPRRAPFLALVLKEIGDLSTHGALETVQASGRVLPASAVAIEMVLPRGDFLALLQEAP